MCRSTLGTLTATELAAAHAAAKACATAETGATAHALELAHIVSHCYNT